MARRSIGVIIAMNRKSGAANLGSKLFLKKDKSKYIEYRIPIGNVDGQPLRELLKLYNTNKSRMDD